MSGLKDYLRGQVVLFDLEYTAWPGSRDAGWSRPGEHREIVEIGAVRLDCSTPDLRVLASFSQLVTPARNPQLSEYFITLTGITQEALDRDGINFPKCYRAFAEFATDADLLMSFGEDDEIIEENLRLNTLPPSHAHRWLNYRALLCDDLGIPRYTCSADLPAAIGLPITARQHRALDDAHAQLHALRHLLKLTAQPK